MTIRPAWGWYIRFASYFIRFALRADRTGGTYSRPVPTAKTPDLVVYLPRRSWTCTECGDRDGWLMSLEDGQPFCLDCVDMAHLVFLPAGDAALSRRARKASSLSAVVIEFSRSRKRYERQGLLVEEDALALAEEQCLSRGAGAGRGSGDPRRDRVHPPRGHRVRRPADVGGGSRRRP